MFKAYLNLTMAMVIVGSSVVAGKIMIDQLPIFFASALRFLIASLLMVPILYFREGGLPQLSRRSWCILCVQALCGSFLFTVLMLFGLTMISPASAGIITSTTPACMGIIGWILLKERPSGRTLAGIFLSVAGVMVLNILGEGGAFGASFLGSLLMVGAVASESLFLLFRKWVPEPLSPIAATTIISLFGFLWFLPAGLYQFFTHDYSVVAIGPWLAVVYYGVVVTVLAYLFWFAGIVSVSSSVASVFTGVMPLSAVCLSALILGEQLQFSHFIGCTCVLGGIALISD
ncbi:DMT family transporter [Maridesulfovibrio frigidus]|uniref:DMT family transporter n=1 Tax=Maridesulfovibrio frigidus TaxID=340956 RepID=UPI0004E266EC|nr:DMT family transporter [Maridesulfovibrio frigidus]